MTSFFRRAKAQILSLHARATDAPTISGTPQLYAKTMAGMVEILAKDGAGEIYQPTPFLGPCRRSYYYLEDFLDSIMSSITVAGTGTSSFVTGPVTGSPGVHRSSIAAIADRVTLLPMATGSTANSLIVGGQHIFEGRSMTTTAQDGTDQWSDRMGLGDNTTSGDATDGIYFESNRAVNGDNNVRLCAASGGVRTKTTMGVAPTAGTFERWKFIVNLAVTSVQGYLNDTATGAAVATNIPTATLTSTYWHQVVKTLGPNARLINRDYLESYQLFNTARS